MTVLLAALPLVVVVAMLLARRSASLVAAAGLAVAVVVAVAVFGLTGRQALDAAGQWWAPVLEVVVIIAGGIAFAEAGRRTGDQGVIADWLVRHLGTGVAPVLAIVHGVTPLAESLTGFGIGLAIGVPLLCALGLRARNAAIIGLLGLCTGPWGAMGPGTIVAAELAGVGADDLGVAGALLSLPVLVGCGVAAVLLEAPRGRRLRAVLAAAASGVLLWGALIGANLLVGLAPAGAVAAAMTLLVHLLVRARRAGRIRLGAAFRRAVLPHAVLLAGVLGAAVIVRVLGLQDEPWRALASPACWLLVATAVVLRSHRRLAGAVAHTAARSWSHVGPATGAFIVLGAVMAASGMSQAIAEALAGSGGLFLALSPVLGAGSGFLAGSNSGANAMFAGPQAAAATSLGVSALPVAAMQNVSSGLFVMASPARIEFATRLCPEPPARGPVTRYVVWTDVLLLVLLVATSVLAIGSLG